MGNLEFRSQLIELKRLLVAAMADEQRLYQRSADADREADHWKSRAELALARGSEDLARAALVRSAEETAKAEGFRRHYLEQREYVQGMKLRLLSLEGRTGSQVVPVAVPRVGEKLERSLKQLELRDERAKEQRAILAARADLERDELAEKLAVLEREDQLERQLAELKLQMGRSST